MSLRVLVEASSPRLPEARELIAELALALYARSGYRRRACYAGYRAEPSSVFMEKLI